MKYVWIVLTIVAMIVMTVWSMILYADTVVEWWIVPAVTLAVGFATGLHMWRWWRWLTREDAMWINYLCHTVCSAIILTFAFFTLNTMLADRSSERIEAGVVKGHFREERRKTRRVGRRYVATGEKYYEYKLQIELADGQTKLVSVNNGRYRQVHNGDSLTVPVMDGLLGLTVIDVDSIKFKPKYKKTKRKSRLKFLGTRGKY